jgi:hypothetical protein
MSFVYEVTVQGTPAMAKSVGDWFAHGPREAWTKLPGLVSLDSYVASGQTAADPYTDDGRGPLMIVVAEFAERAALAAAIDDIVDTIAALPADVSVTGAALERLYYPVAGGSAPAPLEAPVSYVVRYRKPADDEAAFRANYIASHPVTQADMPRIRAILCYLPLDDLRHSGVEDANYLIGNEVVFDSVEDLNLAMQSPVREELRRHYREFPPFSGTVTHFAMQRTRHAG